MIFLFTVCASCRHKLATADYVSYVTKKESGLKKIIEIDGFEYSVQYKPHEYIMLMESKGDFSSYNLKKRTADLKGTAWFNISIKRADNHTTPLKYGVSSLDEYNARLQYYLNEASKDIWLLYGSDTILPASYLFENNYNLAPMETMVVGFLLPPGDKYPKKQMQLSYNDIVFKNGIIKAFYTEEALKNIPGLTLN